MDKFLKYVEETKEADYSEEYKKRLEYEYNICKKLLPDLIQFKDKRIDLPRKLDYNDSIKIAGDFFKSINPELESDYYNIINNEKSDITKFEQTKEEKQRDWDSLFGGPKLETKYGYSVKFESKNEQLETYEDYLNSLTGSASSYGYTKFSMLGNMTDVNTIVHEFSHRFSLSNGAYTHFGECPSIYSELMLYDYLDKNNIVSQEELFNLKKIKFTSYLYRIAVPKILDKNAIDLISSGKELNQETLSQYINSLDENSEDKYAIEFAMQNPETFDKTNRQGFEYIEGVLLASHMKNNNIDFTNLLTDLAHCVDNEDLLNLYNNKYGLNVVIEDGELRISDELSKDLVASFHKEIGKHEDTLDISEKSQEKIKGLSNLVKSEDEITYSYIERESDLKDNKSQEKIQKDSQNII